MSVRVGAALNVSGVNKVCVCGGGARCQGHPSMGESSDSCAGLITVHVRQAKALIVVRQSAWHIRAFCVCTTCVLALPDGYQHNARRNAEVAAACCQGLWCVSAQGTLAAWGCSWDLLDAMCFVADLGEAANMVG